MRRIYTTLFFLGLVGILATFLTFGYLMRPAQSQEPSLNYHGSLNYQVGWEERDLGVPGSPDGWAQSIVDTYEGPMSFQPYMNSGRNLMVIMTKGVSDKEGCAKVAAMLGPIWPEGEVPSYESGAPNTEPVFGIAIFCKGEQV